MRKCEERIFRLPNIYRNLGVAGLLGLLIIGVGGIRGGMSPERHDFWSFVGVLIACAAIGVFFSLAHIRWRLSVTKDGLQLRDSFGRTHRQIPWRSVQSFKLQKQLVQLLYVSETGERIGVPAIVLGVEDLIRFTAEMGVADAKAMLKDPSLRYEGFFDQSIASTPPRPR